MSSGLPHCAHTLLQSASTQSSRNSESGTQLFFESGLSSSNILAVLEDVLDHVETRICATNEADKSLDLQEKRPTSGTSAGIHQWTSGQGVSSLGRSRAALRRHSGQASKASVSTFCNIHGVVCRILSVERQ